MIGVEDQIDAAARGVEGSLAAARMGDCLFAQTMGLADHDVGLVLGEGGDELAVFAPLNAVERDLDAVDPILDLTADLLDGFCARRDQLADRGLRGANPGRVPVSKTLVG